MDMSNVLAAVGKMFPSVNLSGAAEKAQQAISGTQDSLDSVSAAARRLGLDAQTINGIYRKYGQTMQARMLCQMIGTTPEALKADADRIVGVSGASFSGPKAGQAPARTKFPRLK